jgi:hypothetical protein
LSGGSIPRPRDPDNSEIAASGGLGEVAASLARRLFDVPLQQKILDLTQNRVSRYIGGSERTQSTQGGRAMSMPKQLAKRRKIEQKRLRKRERRLERKKTATAPCSLDGVDCFEAPGVVSGRVGEVKMSEVLGDFVRPEIDWCPDRTSLEQLYSMGQIAWNIALEPERRHDFLIEEALDDHMVDSTAWQREACRKFLRGLVTRKLEHFDHYRRPILSFRIDELADGDYNVSVMSGLVW